MQAFNIKRGRKIIDTVFYAEGFTTEQVMESEIEYRGHGQDIIVTKARRVLKDEYEVQGNYGHGWEMLCTEDDQAMARLRLKDYFVNVGGNHRIVHRRVPV